LVEGPHQHPTILLDAFRTVRNEFQMFISQRVYTVKTALSKAYLFFAF
jgi:hypothetical protein